MLQNKMEKWKLKLIHSAPVLISMLLVDLLRHDCICCP